MGDVASAVVCVVNVGAGAVMRVALVGAGIKDVVRHVVGAEERVVRRVGVCVGVLVVGGSVERDVGTGVVVSVGAGVEA